MANYEMRKFVVPEFIFGAGARHRVGDYARHFSARRVLIVSDPGVIAAGWLKEVQDNLAQAGVPWVVFQALTPNPKDHEVMAGALVYGREHCDVIVAVGGGSVVDCAKGIGIVHSNRCNITAFEGVDRVNIPGPPLICIPTTAGAAADVSQFCIICNTPGRYKMAIISKSMVPDVSLVDPETTLTMDPYLTACTGLDALTHAMEAYVSTASSPIVDLHALAAIKLLWHNIETAVSQPMLMAARENMVLGSLQAGIAFSNASLGAVHALAHPLGGYLDLPHGECNALLLEHVIRFNAAAAPERYQQIAEAMGIDPRGLSPREVVSRITDAILARRIQLGVLGSLETRGVRAADIPELASHAAKDACLVTNPRRATVDDIKAIYGEAL
ncbi:alcohol dehydrogenase-like regulatory protein ErcA [Azonexus sp.]|uniref:alcohol dehydrogenase-like regulatory protein ErcA n=1 Tax=Azonexus sp. TaxID=1872668 RepID=UPI0035AF160D